MAKIAYLGPEKTFTEQAARVMFPEAQPSALIPIQPIRNVIRSVDAEDAEYGVVPIENFYNGEVRQTLDSLIECSKAKIVSEKSFDIVHCLGALPNHTTIKQILSKDQALEQCSIYTCKKYPNALEISTTSTSEAARIVKDESRLNAAVIASESALKSYGFEIIEKDICPNNKTRFIAVGKYTPKQTGDDKTFLAIHPSIDRLGILSDISSAFKLFGVNLEYFQSRPDGKKGYIFYAELGGHQEEAHVARAIDAVKYALDPKNNFPDTIKILGSYKNTHWKNED